MKFSRKNTIKHRKNLLKLYLGKDFKDIEVVSDIIFSLVKGKVSKEIRYLNPTMSSIKYFKEQQKIMNKYYYFPEIDIETINLTALDKDFLLEKIFNFIIENKSVSTEKVFIFKMLNFISLEKIIYSNLLKIRNDPDSIFKSFFTEKTLKLRTDLHLKLLDKEELLLEIEKRKEIYFQFIDKLDYSRNETSSEIIEFEKKFFNGELEEEIYKRSNEYTVLNFFEETSCLNSVVWDTSNVSDAGTIFFESGNNSS